MMKQNEKTRPNLITYNCIIDACVKCGNWQAASDIFDEMIKESSITPDMITYSTLIKGYCKTKDI